MLRFTVLAMALALGACSSRSDVIPDGPDAYMIIIAGKTGFTPVGKLKIAAYRQATSYCSSQGRRMETTRDNSVPTGFLRFPEAEIHFKCVTP
jgi:putative hemolysin